MGEAHHTLSTFAAPQKEVFQDFKDHCNGHRVETQLVVLELLRSRHPDFHVTCTWPSKCDLLGYATAGHATATLDCDDSLDSLRYYSEPGPRLEKNPGILKDLVRFGRWNYSWKHSEYLICKTKYANSSSSRIRWYVPTNRPISPNWPIWCQIGQFNDFS
jgi:hypothetical protein